jgi:hypothetical protein
MYYNNDKGGAIYVSSKKAPLLVGCSFFHNMATEAQEMNKGNDVYFSREDVSFDASNVKDSCSLSEKKHVGSRSPKVTYFLFPECK